MTPDNVIARAQATALTIRQRWHNIVAGSAVIAIVVYLMLALLHAAHGELALYVVIGLGGLPLCGQILWSVVHGDFGVDLLAAIALITAVVLGEYLAATLIILMLSGGQTLELYAMQQASAVLEALVSRMPAVVHRQTNNGLVDVPLATLQVNDVVMVYPHEACPVDGIVVEGHGAMDESYLTGEPYHMSKAPGTAVISGAINGDTVLTVRATALPSDSRFAAIVAVLQEAQQKRPKLRRLGDQIGAVFAPVALFLAFAVWLVTGDALRFLSVLVIATPCPLLIAIPVTIISAISMAARQAIIIRDPMVLERLPTCRTAIFDKTGTLTYGEPVLTEIITIEGVSAATVLQLAASLERYSKHPLASAMLRAASAQQLPLLNASHVSETPGAGLRGVIAEQAIHITHRKYLQEEQPEACSQLPGLTVGLECVILLDQKYIATMQFRDMPRTDSQSFIHHLTPAHQFSKIMLVSGDRESEVQYLGSLLALTEVHAAQSPEQKLAIVQRESALAPTLFMGDGINDAPAIAAATVGVAFGQHSNVTSEAAGAVIMENSLQKVDELLHLSMATRRIALQSAVGGMLLSVIGMGFAAAGYVTPVAGAIVQEIIDIVAIANALRLTFKRKIAIDLPS